MKLKIKLAILIILIFATNSFAVDAKFSMWPNAASEQIKGYRIYYGTKSGNHPEVVELGLPSVVDGRISGTVTGLTGGTTYYFVATAYNAAGESLPTAEVVYTPPPLPSTPDGFQHDIVLNIAADNIKINIQ